MHLAIICFNDMKQTSSVSYQVEYVLIKKNLAIPALFSKIQESLKSIDAIALKCIKN